MRIFLEVHETTGEICPECDAPVTLAPTGDGLGRVGCDCAGSLALV